MKESFIIISGVESRTNNAAYWPWPVMKLASANILSASRKKLFHLKAKTHKIESAKNYQAKTTNE